MLSGWPDLMILKFFSKRNDSMIPLVDSEFLFYRLLGKHEAFHSYYDVFRWDKKSYDRIPRPPLLSLLPPKKIKESRV